VPLETLTFEDTEVLVETGVDEVISETIVEVEVLEVAEQGPPGPPGPGGSVSHTATASVAIGGHRAVINTVDGVAYADASDPTHIARVVGVTTSSAAGGSPVTFQASGKITEPSWTWTPDADIFVGLNGLLTQSIPGTAAFAQRLGFALSPTEMWVELGEPIVF
jgi:hypothetical protein